MRQASEPSVEEILELIKKVIARDNRAEAAEERRMRDGDGAQIGADDMEQADDDTPEVEDEVFDLAGSAEFAEHDALDELDEALDETDVADSKAEAPLVTEDARMSMQDSFTALAMLAEPGARPQIVRSGETSLEGMTRDLLRPALADWLEKNLPAIVERLVAAEIARIAGKRG